MTNEILIVPWHTSLANRLRPSAISASGLPIHRSLNSTQNRAAVHPTSSTGTSWMPAATCCFRCPSELILLRCLTLVACVVRIARCTFTTFSNQKEYQTCECLFHQQRWRRICRPYRRQLKEPPLRGVVQSADPTWTAAGLSDPRESSAGFQRLRVAGRVTASASHQPKSREPPASGSASVIIRRQMTWSFWLGRLSATGIHPVRSTAMTIPRKTLMRLALRIHEGLVKKPPRCARMYVACR